MTANTPTPADTAPAGQALPVQSNNDVRLLRDAHALTGDPDVVSVCDELLALRKTNYYQLLAQNAALRAAIDSALEYFEDREDVVDGPYGEPAPNKEMALAQELRAALKLVTP